MYARIAQKLSTYYIRKKYIQESDREIYEYSFEVLISFISNLILIIVLSLIFKIFTPSIFYIISFLPLRRMAGGYHANTHFRCTITLLCVYLVFAALIKIIPCNYYLYVSIPLVIIASVIILILVPVEDHNNPLSDKERKKLRRRVCIILPVMLIITGLLISFHTTRRYGLSFVLGIASVSGSLVAGYIKNLLKKHKKQSIGI